MKMYPSRMNSKACKKCLNVKPMDDFYVHGRMADGHLSFCKTCVKVRVTEHRNGHLDRIREYDRTRASAPHRIQYRDEYFAQYVAKHPERRKAHHAVNNAVRDGRLVKGPCEVCGKTDRTEGHHDDYSKPLQVRWLCSIHHAEVHKITAAEWIST